MGKAKRSKEGQYLPLPYAQLRSDGLGLVEGGECFVGLTCDELDLGFFAQEPGVFFGVGLDLGLAGREEGLGFVELVKICEEEG